MISTWLLVTTLLAAGQADAQPTATQPATTQPSTTSAFGGVEYTGSTELSDEARIEVIGDQVVVMGNENDLRIIGDLIKRMEQAGPAPQIELFILDNAQAQQLASRISQFWNAYLQTRGGVIKPEDRVSVVADQYSNSIIVGATPTNMEVIRDLVTQIDNAPSIINQVADWTPIPLHHMAASQAAEIVRDILQKLQRQSGVQAQFDVQVAPHLNSLLIVAPKKDIEQVKRLIEIIDKEPTSEWGGTAQLLVYPLKRSEAEAVARTLDEMIQLEKTGQGALTEQVRRIRLTRASKPGTVEEAAVLDIEKPIKIIADKGMNAVIIGSTEKNLQALNDILDLLDALPVAEEMNVRIFPLRHADAKNLEDVLKQLFDQGKTLAEVPGKNIKGAVNESGVAQKAMAYNVSITTDPRTNTIIVAGRLEQVAFAQKIIDEMDIEGIGTKFPVQVIHLEHADPDRIADIVTKLNDERINALKNRGVQAVERERVFVVPDPRTESLIISATDENVAEVRDIVAKLDKVPVNFLGDIHIINLTNLTATDLGPKIEQLWQRRMDLKTKRGETYDEMPVIIADTRSNALIVASSKEDYQAIDELVRRLEEQPLSPTQEIRLHVLQYAEAGKIGTMLQDLFQQRAKNRLAEGQKEQPSDRIAIAEDDISNTLLIASSKENYDEMVRLLAQIDVPLDVTGVIRVFPLQFADATRAAAMIQDLFDKGIQRATGAPASALPERQRKVSVITDSRANALIVSATPENFAIVETLLKQIDRKEAPVFTPETRILQITYGDAVKIADLLEKLFEGIRKGLPTTEADELQMTFIPDETSNVILATGSRYGMTRALDLLTKLDRPATERSADIQVYRLEYATAGRLADMIKEVLEEGQSQGKEPRTPFHIVADDGSNSLIVTASRDDQARVSDLLALLDKPSSLSQQMYVLPLKRARAEDLAKTLENILKQQTQGENASFTIAPEPRTNSLVIFAGPDIMSNIRVIAEKLDTTQPVHELAMRVIRLHQAKAEELADRLDKFLKQAAGDKEGRSLIINFADIDDETAQERIRKLVQEDITIAPDPRTNSLLIMAPPDSIDMMERLVETLDEIRPVTAEIRMFVLNNADAEEMMTLLEQLFQVGEKAPKGGAGESERSLVFGGAVGAGAGGGVTTGALELAFSVDKRTNALIVAGSPEYLDTVGEIVTTLDGLDIQNRVQKLIKLNNAVATNVAQTMESYFQAEQQALESPQAEESVLRRLERQVTIQADDDSNTLLVSCSRSMESQVIGMVNQLDQAPPQVMIKVLLAEVTLTDNLELGIEFAAQDLRFTENAVVGPNGTLQGGDFDYVGGTDVGAVGSGSLGGFSFTITGEDFNFLLRALQTEGRLEVLSRPSITVADNQEANITVGETVPVVQDLSISSGGVVTPSVNYRDVGIILDVEPHINSDGFVNMHIMPEISSIATSSVSIGSGINLPIFTQRSADTWVTVRDGETIVIGGLITSRENESENKVPLAGDIPLFGPLFRFDRTEKSKTELLIVLTPEVIRTEQRAHEISVTARDQTGLLDRIRMNPLMERLQVKPGEDRLGPPAEEEPTTRPATTQERVPHNLFGPQLETYGPQTSALPSPAGPPAEDLATDRSDAGTIK